MIESREKMYSIGEACEILKCEVHNLRYIEKAVGLEIKRNEFQERIYTHEDLVTLKSVFELKEQGLNYKAIKKVLEQQGEVAVTNTDSLGSDLVMQPDNVEKFMNFLASTIEQGVESKVTPALDSIMNRMESLEKQNQELRDALEQAQQKYYKELYAKLTKLEEAQEVERNQPWFKKIFGRK
ncbi:hypothetical protein CPJCM30710_22510 [Clostridium polyendosporum]|uniref:HTH merR-type domain-containing protein n=1 Tax=Clostridium polyendosporum TaxID=69208 RepID=A0A919RZS5_9CLOT|nr:MerR family transcriptional regulator [Clostridium polyendosporum]GIM29585.1 hypothetical protein CPJCM30710_22510 [Clostridium polyendosporum]